MFSEIFGGPNWTTMENSMSINEEDSGTPELLGEITKRNGEKLRL